MDLDNILDHFKQNDIDLDKILNFDPFRQAEKITGKKYKLDKQTDLLGCTLQFQNSIIKKQMLKSLNDTYYGIEFKEFLKSFEENNTLFNFEIAYENSFVSNEFDDKEIIFCQLDKGIFIHVCSYHNNLNSCHIYFQIKDQKDLKVRGSFSYKDNEILLDEDGREALFYKLMKNDMNYEYVNPWKHDMLLFFLNYKEKDYDKNIVLNKINMMNIKFKKILEPCILELQNENICK